MLVVVLVRALAKPLVFAITTYKYERERGRRGPRFSLEKNRFVTSASVALDVARALERRVVDNIRVDGIEPSRNLLSDPVVVDLASMRGFLKPAPPALYCTTLTAYPQVLHVNISVFVVRSSRGNHMLPHCGQNSLSGSPMQQATVTRDAHSMQLTTVASDGALVIRVDIFLASVVIVARSAWPLLPCGLHLFVMVVMIVLVVV